MELFRKAKVVRLRSHHEKYLLADDDGETVTQDRNGTVRNARWVVEVLDQSDGIRLKSCYGKYLTASNLPFMLGMKGKKVLQTLPSRLDSSLEWEPIREGGRIRLKTRYGQFLRANRGIPPWRNAITHDVPHRTATQDWILWDMDVVEFASETVKVEPHPPDPSPVDCTSPANISKEIGSPRLSFDDEASDLHEPPSSAPKSEGRMIYYTVADDDGNVAGEEKFFHFKGQTLEELKEKLKEETGIEEILVNCRNPLNGKLYPLLLNLPPNHATIHVIVVKQPASPDEED